MKQILNKVLFIILFEAIMIGYLPLFDVTVKSIIYVIFFIIIIINFKKIIISFFIEPKKIFITMLMVVYVIILKLIYVEVVLDDLYPLVLVVFSFYTFQSVSLKKNDVKQIINITIYSAVIVSSIIIIVLKGSYISAINDLGDYFYNQKNSFSPILAISIIYIFYYLIYVKIRKDYLILSFLGFLNLVIIQSRTNLLMAIIIIVLMILNKIFRNKKKYIYIYILTSLMMIIFIQFKDKLIQLFIEIFKIEYFTSIYSEYGIIDKLTSGRIQIIAETFDIFYKNIFLGVKFKSTFVNGSIISKTGIHNLWIRGLFYGGIIYFTLLIILFVKMIIDIINNNSNKIVIYVLIGMIFNSLFEPYAPFGPGTSYLLYWFILIKDNENYIS